jgi:hypothetical protein
MKRCLLALVVVGNLLPAGAALAGPPSNGHTCRGQTASTAADGQIISGDATGATDGTPGVAANATTFANCGNNP